MSGGNCPETPRQKMIGMMYMMLTAMLALNVSGDLLNAFDLVDKSIKESTKTVDQKNKLLYYNFEAANAQNPKKVQSKYDAALQIQSRADSLFASIQNYKTIIVQTADGPEATPDDYLSKSNQDVPAQVMIVEQGGKRGKDLQNSINEYREFLKSFVGSDSIMLSSLDKMLNTDDPAPVDGTHVSWQSQNFEHLPMAASIALLSKMQSDVRNSQADVVNYLYKEIDKASFKFNGITALVIPESSYVLRGGQYKADIMLAAYDDTMDPIVTVSGQQLPVEAGRGKYVAAASSVGTKKFDAKIEIPDPVTGEMRPYNVSAEYEVGEPSVVVSPSKMNVFYLGVDNPVEISAAGISSSDLKVSATGATITRQGSGFIVKPSQGSAKAKISVAADLNGKTQRLGEKEFRVMRVPNPEANVAGQKSGAKIKKAMLVASGGVGVTMEDFVFDLKFKVQSFTLTVTKGGFTTSKDANGGAFTNEQREMLKGLGKGSKFYIENIKVQGPDGVRKLSSLVMTVD